MVVPFHHAMEYQEGSQEHVHGGIIFCTPLISMAYMRKGVGSGLTE